MREQDPKQLTTEIHLPGVPGPLRGDVLDESKVKIIDGVIHYRLYQQDGTMIAMTAPDTQHNRQIVSWIQIHDRY